MPQDNQNKLHLRQDGSIDRCHYVDVARAYRQREINAFFMNLVFGRRHRADRSIIDEG